MGFETLNEGQFFKENRVAVGSRVVSYRANDRQLPNPQLTSNGELPSFSQNIFDPGGEYNIGRFTPEDIAVTAWWDASDTSTITLGAGNYVFEIANKGANPENFVSQPNGAWQPQSGLYTINGLNTIRFTRTSTQFLYNVSKPDFNVDAAGGFSVFGVMLFNGPLTGPDAQQYIYYHDDGTPGTNGYRFTVYAPGWVPPLSAAFSPADSDNGLVGPKDVLAYHDTPVLFSNIRDDANLLASVYFDGSLFDSDTMTAPVTSDRAIPHYFTLGAGLNNWWTDMTLGEFIFIRGPVGQSTRYKIDGYLAWKWGLVANLPADHPYKENPPINNGF